VKAPLAALSLIMLFFAISSYSQTEPAKTESEKKWFKLFKNDVHVDDFTLKAGETKEVEIITQEPTMVGLMTDASFDLKKGSKYVRLTQKSDSNIWVATLIGASRVFNPADGKITLIAKNETDATLRVVIFKTPKK
jgi:hypothetical protein